MELTIKIEMDNAAFDGNPGAEAARILRKIAKSLEAGDLDGRKLMDVNGNSVGRWDVMD